MAPVLEDVQVEYPTPGTAVAVFTGEHDLATEDAVQDLLVSLLDENELVIADFSDAHFVDASILGVVLDANELAERRGHTFRLQLGTAPIVRRAFEVCRIFDVVDHVHTREEAIARGSR